jgi:uncharacterized membrane protein
MAAPIQFSTNENPAWLKQVMPLMTRLTRLCIMGILLIHNLLEEHAFFGDVVPMARLNNLHLQMASNAIAVLPTFPATLRSLHLFLSLSSSSLNLVFAIVLCVGALLPLHWFEIDLSGLGLLSQRDTIGVLAHIQALDNIFCGITVL